MQTVFEWCRSLEDTDPSLVHVEDSPSLAAAQGHLTTTTFWPLGDLAKMQPWLSSVASHLTPYLCGTRLLQNLISGSSFACNCQENRWQGGHYWVPCASYHSAGQTLHLYLWEPLTGTHARVRWFNMDTRSL